MAFKIHGEVSLDGAMFKRGLNDIGNSTTAFLKNFALGAIGIASVEQAFSKTIESAKELVNTSQRLDIGIEKLQVYRQAAEDAGIGLDQMAAGLEKLGQARAMAMGQGLSNSMTDTKGYGRFFSQLGVSSQMLSGGGSNDEIMKAISDKIKQTANPQDLIEPLREVFGRAGGALIPMLESNFEELEKKMKSFGAIMESQTAHQLKDLSDEIGMLGRVIMAEFAPGIIGVGKVIFLVITALGIFGTALGAYAGLIADIVINFKDWVLHPMKKYNEETDDAGLTVSNYVEKKLGEFNQIFNKKYEEPKPSPVLAPADTPAEKAKREKEIKSDALISVGNFLGSGGREINNLAQQQLTVSLDQLGTLREISGKLDNKYDDGTDFPDA